MRLTLEHICFSYAARGQSAGAVLSDISFTVGSGELIGIMGRTGCGKTTLLQLMDGLLSPTSGRVLLDGADLSAPRFDRKALHRRIGMVFQYPEQQLFETTVERDVAYGLRHARLSREETSGRVRHALETVGFDYDTVRSLSPLALSGGEKRRVAIAGVLASQPELLLFDEPVAGLDPLARGRFLDMIVSLRQGGQSVVMVSHNADALAECADRVLLLDGGHLVADDTAEAVFCDTDRLNRLGLDGCAAGRVARELRARGIPIPDGIYRRQALIDAVAAWKRGTRT